MPVFDYVATTASGKMKKGRVTAENRNEALLQVVRNGLTIHSFREHRDSFWLRDLSPGGRVRLKEKVVFLRQFATIIKAGVTVAEALEILRDQEGKNKYFKSVIEQMAQDLDGGRALSEAFERHPKVFSPMIVHMIRAGENSGRLEESLNHLAVYYERQHRSRQKLSTAMVYPAFVLLMSIAVVLFLLTSIVPMFRTMFASMGGTMPAVTRFVLSISDFLINFWPMLFVLFLALVLFILLLFKNKSSKYYLDHVIIRTPIIGPLIYKSELSRLLWMLALLLSSSVPVIDALRSVEKITSNLSIQRSIRKVTESLDLGRSLSESFARETDFPPIVHHMTAIGETTGMLDQMLNNVARYYEDDVEQMTERMKALIEPVVILLLAVLVGFIVLSIVVPMFQMYQQF